MKRGLTFDTRIGNLTVVEDGTGITEVHFTNEESQGRFASAEILEEETPLLVQARMELLEYAEGRRKEFDLPLAPAGTPFQKKVWEALRTIPYGETRSYKQIAEQVGNPKGCRAVGMANHRNPIGIIIPCHRVVGADGSLTGYAGGLDRKKKLLELEQERFGCHNSIVACNSTWKKL